MLKYKHFDAMRERFVIPIYSCSIFCIGTQSRHVEKLSLNDLYDRHCQSPSFKLVQIATYYRCEGRCDKAEQKKRMLLRILHDQGRGIIVSIDEKEEIFSKIKKFPKPPWSKCQIIQQFISRYVRLYTKTYISLLKYKDIF